MRLLDPTRQPPTAAIQAAHLTGPLPPKSGKVKRICGSFRKNRRGAAVVEFALVVPVFMLLVFGMIEFGRAVMVQQVLVNASREGARQAVLDGTTVAEVESRIDGYLSVSSIDGATIEYEVNGVIVGDPGVALFGDAVTVRISVPFDNVSWLPVPQYIGGTTLTASAAMRRETSQ